MYSKFFLSAAIIFLTFAPAQSQNYELYPTHWWVGMKWNKVQILVRNTSQNIASQKVSIRYDGVKIEKVQKLDNQKYLALDVVIDPKAKIGTVQIEFSENGKTVKIPWELKSRRKGNGTSFAQGITSSDFIYFLMPDRFSNGDEKNDIIAGMKDQSLDRDSIFLRHGGDLQGVINHLDYIQSLGATAVWLTPVIENDMPNRTEHGYAFTNHYKIDARHGGEEIYKKLSDELHRRGMKLIKDAVYNHIGSQHFMALDPPTKDWLHRWDSYTNTSYKDQPLFDPYASKADKKRMSDGWFTPNMPDLNQNNPLVANFQIQNALWAVEEFGIDAWRIDTYAYNDLVFMNRCNKALLDEYPKIFLFGETWVHGVTNQAFFVNNNFDIPFKSNLTGVTDFQLNLYGITKALNEPFGWTEGASRLYSTLAQDFVYKDATRNVIFLDNHDLDRFFTQIGENVAKQKMGLAWLFTCRGIPQLYYGTEILMKGSTHPFDGNVRLDFPGGWKGDTKNAFTQVGLTQTEKEIQDYTKLLGNFRKNSSALKTGKLQQYVPSDGLYVYFRYDSKQTIMCVMNTSDQEKEIDFGAYSERTNGFKKAIEISSKDVLELNSKAIIGGKKLFIFELQ